MSASFKAKDFFTKARYRKVVWFFGRIFLHTIWWDLFLRQFPLLRQLSERTAMARWRRIARRFRDVAVDMGGVLIKLGQFLSIRVDVLPAEVISELAGLQDEVPPEDPRQIQALIESEFEKPLETIFATFENTPLGAASLSQAHRATLPSGEQVVVKVQRHNIEEIVNIDLNAISLALGWLKYYPRVNQRVDLDQLSIEFTTVTQHELDFIAEGHNAERFAADFATDPQIYIPRIYWEFSRRRVLTMEDVSYIRISDLDALDKAGIDRPAIAKKLYNVYMEQIFNTYFVHVDAHPGNLFVKPLPKTPPLNGRDPQPFQVIFIDFGMMATVPKRVRTALRNYAIALGTRDIRGMIQAYDDAGVLLPGADKRRLEEVHREMFNRFWGVNMSEIRNLALQDAEDLFEEYKDLVYDAPFQFQADMLFVVRSVGLMSGVATSLDPNFDPWTETIPFAQALAREELERNWRDWVNEAAKLLMLAAKLPQRLDNFLEEAERGTLPLETSFGGEARRNLRQLEKAVNRLTWAVIGVGGFISGIVLRVAEGANNINTGILVVSGGLVLWKLLR